jgi:hypothetical protein
VLGILVPDLLVDLALWNRSGTSKSHPILARLAIALLCPLLAVLLLVAQQLISVHLWNYTSRLVIYYFTLNLALLTLPRDSWLRMIDIAPDLDALITDDDDRRRLVAVLDRTAQLRYQLSIGFATSVVGIIIAALIAEARNVPPENAIAYELSLGMTLLLGSNVVIWMVNGLRYLYVRSRLESVHFDQIAPEQAPGLRRIYALMTRVQWYATGGLLLSVLPLALVYVATPRTRVLHAAVVVASIIAFAVVVLVYTLPPWFLHVMRERDKERLLSVLRRELPVEIIRLEGTVLRHVVEKLALYEHLRTRPTGGLDRAMITSLLLALATVAAGFLPLLVGTPHA